MIHSSVTQRCLLLFLFSRQEGLAPETAPAAERTPSETEVLLLLWILTYCCFILHHLIST